VHSQIQVQFQNKYNSSDTLLFISLGASNTY